MQRPTPEPTPATSVEVPAPPGLLSPSHWEAVFERAALTVSVLVVSVALVTRRYPPEVRAAALAGLWSGFVALSAAAWAATAVAAAIHRRLPGTRRRTGAHPDRAQGPFLDKLGAVTLRVFAPFVAPAPATSDHPVMGSTPAAPAPSVGGGRVDGHQLARAAFLMADSATVAWSAGVLGSPWQPLCTGLVEALAVAFVYRLARAFRQTSARSARRDRIGGERPAGAAARALGARS